MSEFDPGHGYHDGPDYSGAGRYVKVVSAEKLRDQALVWFGRFMERLSQREIPPELTPDVKKYLSVDEVALILKEHAEEAPEGFVVSGASREELAHALRELMASLMQRILSNVLAHAVNQDLLACTFDGETNDFSFHVTEKGIELRGKSAGDGRPSAD